MNVLLSFMKVFLCIHAITITVIDVPIACNHAFGYMPQDVGLTVKSGKTWLDESELNNPPYEKKVCVKCGKRNQDLCVHEFATCADNYQSGDSFIHRGYYQQCQKPGCNYRTPTTQGYPINDSQWLKLESGNNVISATGCIDIEFTPYTGKHKMILTPN